MQNIADTVHVLIFFVVPVLSFMFKKGVVYVVPKHCWSILYKIRVFFMAMKGYGIIFWVIH